MTLVVTCVPGGVGTFGKYLITKVVGSKTEFGQKTQKYVGTFGLKGEGYFWKIAYKKGGGVQNRILVK